MLERSTAHLAVIATAAAAVGFSAPGAAVSAPAPGAAAPPAQIGQWGIDLGSRDLSVKPGDDFYRYADGHWLDTHEIPPDRSRWGAFDELQERSLQQLRGILEALPEDATPGSNIRKLRDFYGAYLDTDAVERAGLTPARAGLEAIAAARTHEDIGRLMERAELRLTAPVEFRTAPRSEEHTSELQSQSNLVCRLLLEKKNN